MFQYIKLGNVLGAPVHLVGEGSRCSSTLRFWDSSTPSAPVHLIGEGSGCSSTPSGGKVLGAPVHLVGEGFGCYSTHSGGRFWVLQYT